MPRRSQAAQQAAPAPEPVAQPRSRVRPVRSTRHDHESSNEKIGQDRPRRMKSTGPARGSLEAAHVEVVDRPVSKEKLDMLAFMEEPVTVMVHQDTNPLADPLPTVWNGGVRQSFPRGKNHTVKRKFVEVLARLKKTSYTQRKEKGENDVETYINIPHTALLYPFNVVEDKNPRGRAWLQAIFNEA